MSTSPLPSLETTCTVGYLVHYDQFRLDAKVGFADQLYQLILAREAILCLASSQSSWHGGITARIVYDMVVAELWSDSRRADNYGVVYPQASYWGVRSVVGKVLAPLSAASASASPSAGASSDGSESGIKCLGGWVGPCPSPALPESTFGIIVEVQARHTNLNAAAFVTQRKRGTTAGATPEWTEPVTPPASTDSARLQTLRLIKVDHLDTPAGANNNNRAPRYRARLDFLLVRSKITVSVLLHANSVFVAAPKCGGAGPGAHRVDPRSVAAYTFRVLTIEDLPRAEPECINL
ncbi:hypothetical protein MYCTH_2128538 [Thermothelomyces thermophilus ATCC 42464]|uniref:Uncharacterized protein n=1 Tax=Thermothelomyces thermophilus (strain ATCC 42464 / BCRC 31852 / DSM 1799) TaxID=573729 RepID=G2QGX2_THET4|nr:uncharacterized protein MYCTH_2128538 [Thermothelomyces thermophilus ATCC 42464]AEO59479.1 hypothetical protein MYCTH_2128538 [Thermothelomyces thermophilus ATCC 42464]